MDRRVINLNAFGEEVLPKEVERKFFSDDSDDEHIRTEERPFRRTIDESPKYAQHKALDKLFKSLIDLGDNLAESIMGKYGRPHLSEENLCLKLFNYNNNLSYFMDELYSCYRNDCRCLFEENKDSELLNIIDEIISLIDRIKYLLTLE